MSIKLWCLSWRWHWLVHVCRRWRCVFCVAKLSRPLVMPWSSPEPKFKPEPLRTGPRSSPKFSHGPEPDQSSAMDQNWTKSPVPSSDMASEPRIGPDWSGPTQTSPTVMHHNLWWTLLLRSCPIAFHAASTSNPFLCHPPSTSPPPPLLHCPV